MERDQFPNSKEADFCRPVIAGPTEWGGRTRLGQKCGTRQLLLAAFIVNNDNVNNRPLKQR
jgi:hypothetical protein